MKKSKKIITATVILLSILNMISCTKDMGPIEPEIIITTVSFENDVQPIFNANCTYCHNTMQNQFSGYLDLSVGKAYSELVDVISYGFAPNVLVVQEDYEASILWKKISGTGEYGLNMPMGAEELTTTERETIKVWIEEGALEN